MGWPCWVSDVADDKLFQVASGFASIIALLITYRVWRNTRKIVQRISANVRLPVLGQELQKDLTELNRLNLANAPVDQISANLAVCRARLRSIRRYRSGIRRHYWISVQILFARLFALAGVDLVVRRIGSSAYGDLLAVVLEIEDFAARIPLGANHA